jgi:hypothetical protein
MNPTRCCLPWCRASKSGCAASRARSIKGSARTAAACPTPSLPRQQGRQLPPMCRRAVGPRPNHFLRAAGRRRSRRRGRRRPLLTHQRHRRRHRLFPSLHRLPPRRPRPKGGWLWRDRSEGRWPRIFGWLSSPPHDQAVLAGSDHRSMGPISSARHDHEQLSAPSFDASNRGSELGSGARPKSSSLLSTDLAGRV